MDARYERRSLLQEIYRMVNADPDEIIDGDGNLDDPYISVGLPEGFRLEGIDLGDGEFLDELWGLVDEVKEGWGMVVCISKEDNGCCTRVDEMDVDYLPLDDLTHIIDYLRMRG